MMDDKNYDHLLAVRRGPKIKVCDKLQCCSDLIVIPCEFLITFNFLHDFFHRRNIICESFVYKLKLHFDVINAF